MHICTDVYEYQQVQATEDQQASESRTDNRASELTTSFGHGNDMHVMHDPDQHVEELFPRCSAPSTKTRSCLRDALMMLAAARSHHPVFRDLSVIRRDTVPAGFTGSRRAKMNFIRVANILIKHQVSVCVFSYASQQLCKHYIGTRNDPCLGYLFWDVDGQHVSTVTSSFVTHAESMLQIANEPPPWVISCAGGKLAKRKPKPKKTKK